MTDTLPPAIVAGTHYYADYDPTTGRILALHQRDPLNLLAEGVGAEGIGRLKLTDDQVDGVWSCQVVGGVLTPKSDTALAAQVAAAALADLRIQRDALLSASDIRVLPDRWAVMTDAQRAAWSLYRQALRDLPTTITDPTAPAWPVQPA
ncbi:MAG: phage tail assembly chaperone [Azospirillaceae bacterium]|nr:phage tail assembly chaperone [Azospirillaceae bacterium]